MVSVITAWGVRWTGLPHSPKTDSDRLIKDNLVCYCPKTDSDRLINDNLVRYCPKTFEMAKGKKERWCRRESLALSGSVPEALGSITSSATFLSFPLPFQRSSDSNGPDCL